MSLAEVFDDAGITMKRGQHMNLVLERKSLPGATSVETCVWARNTAAS